MKAVAKTMYDGLQMERLRLVSKKLVEGLSRREQEQLERVESELAQIKVKEEVVEFDYFY